MNSHSCTIASLPAKMSAPIERAGFTDVPVRGMVAKWIIDSESPMANGARAGCSLRSSVTARISDHEDEGGDGLDEERRPPREPAAVVAEAVLPEVALGAEPVEALPDDPQHVPPNSAADELTAHVEGSLRPGQSAAEGRAEGHGGVEVATGDPADGVRHHQHGEPEGEAGGDHLAAGRQGRADAEEDEDESAEHLGGENFWAPVGATGAGAGAVSAMPRCSLVNDRWIRCGASSVRRPVGLCLPRLVCLRRPRAVSVRT